MSTISILKIESNSGIVLTSSDATQEVYPLAKAITLRNLDFDHIPRQGEDRIKYGCSVETSFAPNLPLLKFNEIFRIFSIVKFRENGSGEPSVEYVPDSLEKQDGFITFRPVLKVLLSHFKAKDSSADTPVWRLEFEEV